MNILLKIPAVVLGPVLAVWALVKYYALQKILVAGVMPWTKTHEFISTGEMATLTTLLSVICMLIVIIDIGESDETKNI